MIEVPIDSFADNGAWLDPDNIAEFAKVAEEIGVGGLALTDHPAPSQKWLEGGGHETYDPFVGLGYIAGVTSTIKLITYLTVVPYRNPFLTAKSMVSVDRLSKGRAIFALGTGYLRSEFGALGVSFDDRNELFDECMEVIIGAMGSENFSFEGKYFKAVGQTIRPGVVQTPHPPFWIGGNAKIGLRRVAKWAQGWAPLGGGAQLAKTARTKLIEGEEELATMIAMVKEMMAENGRDPNSLDICLSGLNSANSAEAVDQAGRMVEMGATWATFGVPHETFKGGLDALRRFGAEVIAKV